LFLPLISGEQGWPNGVRAFIYLVMLCWCFIGVSIVADIFMGAIEAVTSRRKMIQLSMGRVIPVKVWNDTVANLTLMALGSSAPEILLSVIEILAASFYSGELGPSTIVGSAAFNLLVILGVCVYVIPDGESRTIKAPIVFYITAVSSVFAYLWLILILALSSPDVVEPWEGIVTFLFFPVLVVLAYLADIGYFSRVDKEEVESSIKQRLEEEGTNELTDTDVRAISQHVNANSSSKSWAARRLENSVNKPPQAVKGLPSTDLAAGFLSRVYSFSKAAQELVFEVELVGRLANDPERQRVGIMYRTMDGSLRAEVGDYKAVADGYIEIPAGEFIGRIAIKRELPSLMEDKEGLDKTETFFSVKLLEVALLSAPTLSSLPSGSRNFNMHHADGRDAMRSADRKIVPLLPDLSLTKARIVDDDSGGCGQLRLETTSIDHVPSESQVTRVRLKVQRFNGSQGEISCDYSTEADSAREGKDFFPISGELVFAAGVMEKFLEVDIKQKSTYESKDSFFLNISGPMVVGSSAVCNVVIQAASDSHNTGHQIASKAARALDSMLNFDSVAEGNIAWRDQIVASFFPTGSKTGSSSAGVQEWTVHFIAFPWKLFFSFIPPTTYFRGWLCFFVALVFIGVVTAVIADFAGLLGCVLGLQDSITAITIVALGTSLPDTFASKVAAVQDETADAAIGNVTGSNSVNVFLGLGLPWMIASIYWTATGSTAQWRAKYPTIAPNYPDGGFVVVAGDLVYSVSVFCLTAFCAIGTILYRRKAFKAELGGDVGLKKNTAIFFVLLWVMYVSLASWKVVAGDVSVGAQILAIFGGCLALGVGMAVISVAITLWDYNQAAKRKDKEEQFKTISVQVAQMTTFLGMTGARRSGFGKAPTEELSLGLKGPSGFNVGNEADKEGLRHAVEDLRTHIDHLSRTCSSLEASLNDGAHHPVATKLSKVERTSVHPKVKKPKVSKRGAVHIPQTE